MTSNLVQQQDQLRTQRNFVSLIAGAFGIPDQTYTGEDGLPINYPREYQVVNTATGAVGVQGASLSTAQTSVVLGPVALLAGVGLLAWLLLRRKG